MSGALCYPPCKPGFDGKGPVCWQSCPAGYYDCGGALCTTSAEQCSDFAKGMTKNIFDGIVAVLPAAFGEPIDVMKLVKSSGGVAYELANAKCDSPAFEEFEVENDENDFDED